MLRYLFLTFAITCKIVGVSVVLELPDNVEDISAPTCWPGCIHSVNIFVSSRPQICRRAVSRWKQRGVIHRSQPLDTVRRCPDSHRAKFDVRRFAHQFRKYANGAPGVASGGEMPEGFPLASG